MKLKAIKDFSWAHRGCDIEEFKAGQVINTEDADLIKVSKAEGWAKPLGKGGDNDTDDGDGKKANDDAADNKANASAPENK